MNNPRKARIVAGVILAGMLFGSVSTASATMMGGTSPVAVSPDSGWMMQPPAVGTTDTVAPPSDVTSVPATPPSTDTTSWVCPRPGTSYGTTPSVPASPAPWPMPYVGGTVPTGTMPYVGGTMPYVGGTVPTGTMPYVGETMPGVGTTITIGCNVRGVPMPRAFVLSGVLAGAKIGDPSVVEVMKPGTSRWSYSSMRLVYTANGDWWYRYTPKMRGTYRFRARPAAVTAAAGVTPMSKTIVVTVR